MRARVVHGDRLQLATLQKPLAVACNLFLQHQWHLGVVVGVPQHDGAVEALILHGEGRLGFVFFLACNRAVGQAGTQLLGVEAEFVLGDIPARLPVRVIRVVFLRGVAGFIQSGDVLRVARARRILGEGTRCADGNILHCEVWCLVKAGSFEIPALFPFAQATGVAHLELTPAVHGLDTGAVDLLLQVDLAQLHGVGVAHIDGVVLVAFHGKRCSIGCPVVGNGWSIEPGVSLRLLCHGALCTDGHLEHRRRGGADLRATLDRLLVAGAASSDIPGFVGAEKRAEKLVIGNCFAIGTCDGELLIHRQRLGNRDVGVDNIECRRTVAHLELTFKGHRVAVGARRGADFRGIALGRRNRHPQAGRWAGGDGCAPSKGILPCCTRRVVDFHLAQGTVRYTCEFCPRLLRSNRIAVAAVDSHTSTRAVYVHEVLLRHIETDIGHVGADVADVDAYR